MKLHFNGAYDFHKYNGKTSATAESFEKRKDKFKFAKLSDKLSDPQILDYYLANFIRGKENDIEKLLTKAKKFDIIFQCDDGKHPILVKQYLGKKISLETLIVLEKVVQYKEVFSQQIKETFIWPKLCKLLIDYEPFLKIDVRQYRMITLNKVQEGF